MAVADILGMPLSCRTIALILCKYLPAPVSQVVLVDFRACISLLVKCHLNYAKNVNKWQPSGSGGFKVCLCLEWQCIVQNVYHNLHPSGSNGFGGFQVCVYLAGHCIGKIMYITPGCQVAVDSLVRLSCRTCFVQICIQHRAPGSGEFWVCLCLIVGQSFRQICIQHLATRRQ